MTPIEKVRAALKHSGILIKLRVKPEKYVTRGDITDGTDISKIALETYKEIQEALRELEGHVIVPVEPTIEQTNKAVKYFTCNSKNLASDAYRAMIAPYLPKEGE